MDNLYIAGLHTEGKVNTTAAVSTAFNIDVSGVPGDEPMLVLLSNESATISARLGFGTATANSPALASGNERQMMLPARLIGQMAVMPMSGTGVQVGYQVFRMVRR